MEHIYLSRRNLLVLLSKLKRKEKGEETRCTIVKYRNESDPYKQTMDSICVTAVLDDEYYFRDPGEMFHADEPEAL